MGMTDHDFNHDFTQKAISDLQDAGFDVTFESDQDDDARVLVPFNDAKRYD